MIRASGVAKSFDSHRILEDVAMAVERGERVALLGLNGTGKTTLIRCILGLVPFTGRLEVAGVDVRTHGREARSEIGYVPQRAPHFQGTLGEMISFIGKLRDADPERVHAQLSALGLPLETFGDKAVNVLSGGMLQKALLALALGSNVGLLLLDEPTANLDPRARREFLRTLRQVDRDTTVLLASHRLGDVDAVADRLLVLSNGRIAFDGRTEELWARAGADVVLWLKIPAALRNEAREQLRVQCHLPTVQANGAALGVRVDRGGRADVIATLRSANVPVEDFWTEAPSLEDLLELVLDPDTRPEHTL